MVIKKKIFIPIIIVIILSISCFLIFYFTRTKSTNKSETDPSSSNLKTITSHSKSCLPSIKDTLLEKFVILQAPLAQCKINSENRLLRKMYNTEPNSVGLVLNITEPKSTNLKTILYEYLGSNSVIENFAKFKAIVIKSVSVYRKNNKTGTIPSLPDTENRNAIIYSKNFFEKNSCVAAFLNIINTNIAYKNFILSTTNTETKDLLLNLLLNNSDSIVLSNEEVEKLSELCNLRADYRIKIQHPFFLYQSINLNSFEKEERFIYAMGDTGTSTVFKYKDKKDVPIINIFFSQEKLEEVNLQALLWGIEKKSANGETELIFPVFLNAPPFLNFSLNNNTSNANTSFVFQETIEFPALGEEKVVSSYSLTGFICYYVDEMNKKTYTSFFKSEHKWKWIDNDKTFMEIPSGFDFKTHFNSDEVGVEQLFYLKNK
ncbi:hypothetical protein CDIK_2068 [Cucumispora dikerogammari]|nr:hypothetical protein CDIK_2068 [Cucumispora dikerogammari]